jgi:hypothetical protein
VLAGQEPLAEPVEGAHPACGTLAHRRTQIDRVDPGLDAHRKDFGERHPETGIGAIVHELGDRAGDDRTDTGGLVAHRVGYRLVAVADLLVVRAAQSWVMLYFDCFDAALLGIGKRP